MITYFMTNSVDQCKKNWRIDLKQYFVLSIIGANMNAYIHIKNADVALFDI